MRLYHHTTICQDIAEFHYDETLQDNVYTLIPYWLVTHEISMEHGRDLKVETFHRMPLPPPSAENFVPFKDVDLRVMLRWIHENEENLTLYQMDNTIRLAEKYNIPL